MSGEYSTAQKVLDALVGTGILTAEQLANVSEAAASEGRPVGPMLVERGLVSSDDVASVLEEEMGVPRVDLSSYAPEDEALSLVPAGVARQRTLLPLFDIEGILTVAIGDPVDVFALDDVAAQLGVEIEPVLADSAELLGAVVQYYGELDVEIPESAGESAAEPVPETPAAPAAPAAAAEGPVAGDTEVGDERPLSSMEAAQAVLESLAPAAPAAEVAEPAAEAAAFELDEIEEALLDEAGVADAAAPGVISSSAFDLGSEEPPVAPVIEELYEEPAAEEVMAPVAPEPDMEPEPVADEGPSETIEAVAEAEQAEGDTRIDLDVLAVADAKRVGVLVSNIVEAAVAAGASHIQVLPYKEDFFLVYRVKGRLEKVASAPLSLQGALVEGVKHFARLSDVPASRPALGRVRAKYGGRDLAITVSAVPTVSGQRVVITLKQADREPRSLDELGMSEAEERALHAMVERGRGMLLMCAPVAGGRSQTYYSLLGHAAESGKTVYSVERSIGYEIPAVAQVMVNPGSPVRPSAYIAAGLRQDTDVIAVDSLQSTEDIHLAVEAAGRGRLVVATFAAGDIMSGVRRILDLGVEPHSLAAALTVAVGQRLVRTNCPNCSEEVRSPLNAKVPGVDADAVTIEGTGCPNCRKTGFAGVTGVFEVLPFTEEVRAAVARDASLEELESAAHQAGMRPLVRSGVAKVEAGLVSVAELDRVLRFDG